MNSSSPINHLEELLLLYSEEINWDYNQLSDNASITEHLIEAFHDKNWNYYKLSSNPAIGFKFILDHPIKKPVFNHITNQLNEWDCVAFAGNPSLDVNKIPVEVMSKPFLDYPVPLNIMILDHNHRYQQCNRFFRNDVKTILKQYEQNNCIENDIANEIIRYRAFENQYLGPLSYCFVKLMYKIDQKRSQLHYFPHNSEIDERFVELIHSLNGNTYYWSPCNNCISLEYVATNLNVYWWKNFIGKYTQLTNPSIIQSIYNMYRQIKDYYGNREMPNKMDYEELEHMSKIGELHLSTQLSTSTRIKDILNISPYKEIYYEDNVIFTQEQFTELACLDTPLLKFSNNPNFEWETIADWTWKNYDLKLLSYNPFQQHIQYRKSQILYELETVGIYLEWNQLDNQIYDDFDCERFLAKLEKEAEAETENVLTTKRSKRLKL